MLAVAKQYVVFEVECRKQGLGTLIAMIRRWQPLRFPNLGPMGSRVRPDLQRSEFINIYHMSVCWLVAVEFLGPFFLESNSGSFDSFHVLVR